jgi:hypothetical protein
MPFDMQSWSSGCDASVSVADPAPRGALDTRQLGTPCHLVTVRVATSPRLAAVMRRRRSTPS